MRSLKPAWYLTVVASLAAVWVGCGDGDDPKKSNRAPAPNLPAPVSVSEAPPAPALKIPEVKLLEKDRDTCLKYVGETMPEAELSDPGGEKQSLRPEAQGGLFGRKLTVICFWTSGESPYGPLRATRLLEDLERDYARAYQEKGLKVIGINEGDTAEIVSQRVQEAEATFPVLLDPEGTFFAQVATEKLPRIYLVDADGKVLWLDIEYSLTTQEQLRQAVQVALEETE